MSKKVIAAEIDYDKSSGLSYEETLSKAQKLVYYDFKDSIPDRYKEDAVQELCLHAWNVGNNSWGTLSNKLIDYYRRLCKEVYPSVPFIDMDSNMMAERQLSDMETASLSFTIKIIADALRKYYCKNVWVLQNVEIAERILDIILEDIDECKRGSKGNGKDESHIINDLHVNKYRFDGISRGYLEQRMKDINVKKINKGKELLKQVVRDLIKEHKIEI